MSTPTGKRMSALARRVSGDGLAHRIEIRDHQLIADEPEQAGGADTGPTPQELLAASLASCTSITLAMYAGRKGWDLGPLEVDCEYAQPERGATTTFTLVLRLPRGCSEEQIERLRTIAAKCPVHRTLAGDVAFEERVELR